MLQQKKYCNKNIRLQSVIDNTPFSSCFLYPPPPLDVETRIPNDSNGAIQLAQQPCEKPETTDITK